MELNPLGAATAILPMALAVSSERKCRASLSRRVQAQAPRLSLRKKSSARYRMR